MSLKKRHSGFMGFTISESAQEKPARTEWVAKKTFSFETCRAMRTSPWKRSSRSGLPEDGRFPPGRLLIDRYRVISLAGRGGMGEVYRATDLTLNQPVALKFLPPATAGSRWVLGRIGKRWRLLATYPESRTHDSRKYLKIGSYNPGQSTSAPTARHSPRPI